MSEKDGQKEHGLIETAMGRIVKPVLPIAESVDSRSPEERLAKRREQDRALEIRLEQLNTAIGNPALKTPAVVGLATVAPVVPFSSNNAPVKPWDHGFSAAALVVTAILSAIVGALLMRVMTDHADTAEIQMTAPAASPSVTATALSATAATTKPGALPQEDEAQTRALIERWKQAWEQRDVDAYLGCYAPTFSPAKGQSLSAWRKARRVALAGRTDIRVTLSSMRWERLSPDEVQVSFLQDYRAGHYEEKERPKTLVLTRVDGSWQIAGEWQGARQP